MAKNNENLWAPWRMEYIRSLENEQDDIGCFLCDYWQHLEDDTKNHVIWRTDSLFVVMNRFPYTNGHLLIALAKHKGDLSELSNEEMCDMSESIRSAVDILRKTVHAQGFNIGYNIGRCAGAGLPDHLHAHIVPRWSGDTNYMSVLGKTRIIPDALDSLCAELVKQAIDAGLRS